MFLERRVQDNSSSSLQEKSSADTREAMEANFSAIISSILAILLALLFISSWKKKKNNKNLPPGPLGLPVVGSLPFLGGDLHVSFKSLSDVYGPIMSLRLGSKLSVVLSSPATVREALKDNDLVFANHDVPAVALISSYGARDILWAPYGPFWKTVRKITVRELLSSATLNGLYSLRKAQIEKMMAEVKRKSGSLLNLRELVSAVAMKTVVEMLWGGSVEESGEEREAVEREFRAVTDHLIELIAVPNLSDFFPALAPLDLQRLGKRSREISAWLGRILDRVIDPRRRSITIDQGRRDFLQVLLDSSEHEPEITTDVMKAILLDMTSAGTDTTATTVEWAMAELLNDPEKMKRVKEEIASAVGEGVQVEETHLGSLPYLSAAVKETLRLHPVLPLLVPHRPSSTCTIAGYTIPEGTQVFINAWAIQRDPGIWADALDFKPERFMGKEGNMDYSGNTFKFLPFGAGRRICPGIQLGERMAMFVLASLLHSVDWALPDGEKLEFKEKFGLVMKKEKPLAAIPTHR